MNSISETGLKVSIQHDQQLHEMGHTLTADHETKHCEVHYCTQTGISIV